MNPGVLYVVATPIGNLEDFTFRAVRVLKDVDLIACEDTRHARILLNHYGIATRMISYHEHNEQRRAPELLKQLQKGRSVALISDAGTPVLSDPGYMLIRHAISAGIPVISIPGASAITAALAVAGLPTDHFVFVGFLPRKFGDRTRALEELARLPWTLVMFETPHRIVQTLEDMHTGLGNRHVALVRELTKKFEEVLRGSLLEVLERVRVAPPRGELTLVVEGTQKAKDVVNPSARLKVLLESGMTAKDAVRVVAEEHGIPRRTVYQLALEILGKRAAQ